MRSCIDLILSGGSSFEFSRILLKNQIENIGHTGSPSQARACLMLVEQLGTHLKELKTLENAGSVDEARITLGKLLIAQEHERKEMEEQIAEEGRHLQHLQADHQRLISDSKESEIVVQSAEQVIATARVTIARAQALIETNEQKLVATKKRLEELETARTQVEENFSAYSSRLESLQAQLATKRFLSEEELRVQALVEAERARQHEMHHLCLLYTSPSPRDS